MIEHPTIKRTFIVSDQALADPNDAAIVFRFIFSAMLFPEDDVGREMWILANIIDLLNNKNEQQVEDIVSKFPHVATKLFLQKELIINKAKSTTYSRQSPHGKTTTKGTTAGYLLYYLAQPHINSLSQACEIYHMSEHRLHGKLLTPSTSTLKSSFGEFKHVAHLWAALHAHRRNYDDILCPGLRTDNFLISPDHHKHLLYYLKLSSFFRYNLTETVNPSTSKSLIKDYDKVWNIVSENNRPFPQAKLTLQ